MINNDDYNYIELLYSNLPIEMQKQNIEFLATNENYSNEMFLQQGEKGAWENEARVLIYRGYPKIKNVLIKTFEWLQDMNWPGALEISKMLSSLPKDVLVENLEKVTIFAKKQNDIGWLYWLRELMESSNLKADDFHDKNVFDILNSSTDM